MEGEIVSGGSSPEPHRPQGVEADPAERIVAGQWSGPLPPPAALEQFERSAPGAADRILGMAEREEEHRHTQERAMLRSDTQARARGQWMAFLVALVIIAGGIWLISKGKQWEGLVAVLTPLATLVGIFIYSTSAPGGD
jgi:uncharacterized membrane protein